MIESVSTYTQAYTHVNLFCTMLCIFGLVWLGFIAYKPLLII